MVWLVTLTAVVVLGVDIGLLAGVVFSMFTFIVRTQHPRCEVIANVRGTDLYRNCKTCQTVSDFKKYKTFVNCVTEKLNMLSQESGLLKFTTTLKETTITYPLAEY